MALSNCIELSIFMVYRDTYVQLQYTIYMIYAYFIYSSFPSNLAPLCDVPCSLKCFHFDLFTLRWCSGSFAHGSGSGLCKRMCVCVCWSVCVASVFVCGESHRGFFIFLQQVYSLLRFACDLQRLIGALQMLRESPRCLPPSLSPSLSSFLSLSLSLCCK